MKIIRPLPLFISLAIIFLLILQRLILSTREPADPYRPAGHDEYMRDEYGDMWAFVKAEERIDAFLLELENK